MMLRCTIWKVGGNWRLLIIDGGNVKEFARETLVEVLTDLHDWVEDKIVEVVVE